jgi:hypothetical protein
MFIWLRIALVPPAPAESKFMATSIPEPTQTVLAVGFDMSVVAAPTAVVASIGAAPLLPFDANTMGALPARAGWESAWEDNYIKSAAVNPLNNVLIPTVVYITPEPTGTVGRLEPFQVFVFVDDIEATRVVVEYPQLVVSPVVPPGIVVMPAGVEGLGHVATSTCLRAGCLPPLMTMTPVPQNQ